MRIRATLALCLLLAVPAAADDASLNLAIGDPARRDRTAPLVLDAATDTATGQALSPDELAAKLDGVRLLFVGESHTSIEFHNVQLAVLQALARRGRPVLLGLEMFPYTEQAALDLWNAGTVDEAAFVTQSRWYRMWGYHWNYYRDIFLAARAAKIQVHAVNTPREVVSAVRKKGFKDLTPDEAAHIPERIDVDDAEHMKLFRAFFEGGDGMHSTMSEEMWTAMFRAQCTWDATMGYNAVQALKKDGRPDAIMVVLIGSGHVAYGKGAERQARLWFDGKMASLIPVPVVDDKGAAPVVRASYADYLWGVAHEKHALYPSLGLSTPERKDGEPAKVIAVPKDSVAGRAGFEVGDVLLSMDGVALEKKETIATLMSGKRWGDTATFRVRRGEQELMLVAAFRRQP
ncbi:MAG: ChaN family lipoprotein [Vicinamibacteria bacterium]|jgi:uncharacterized iron-regulated protein|nr:ChaN family lipoprotein [Vicinamibacteria bacterium]